MKDDASGGDCEALLCEASGLEDSMEVQAMKNDSRIVFTELREAAL